MKTPTIPQSVSDNITYFEELMSWCNRASTNDINTILWQAFHDQKSRGVWALAAFVNRFAEYANKHLDQENESLMASLQALLEEFQDDVERIFNHPEGWAFWDRRSESFVQCRKQVLCEKLAKAEQEGNRRRADEYKRRLEKTTQILAACEIAEETAVKIAKEQTALTGRRVIPSYIVTASEVFGTADIQPLLPIASTSEQLHTQQPTEAEMATPAVQALEVFPAAAVPQLKPFLIEQRLIDPNTGKAIPGHTQPWMWAAVALGLKRLLKGKPADYANWFRVEFGAKIGPRTMRAAFQKDGSTVSPLEPLYIAAKSFHIKP